MRLYVYICICVYVYMCIYVYMYICICVCMYRHGCQYMDAPFDSHAIEYLLVRSQGLNVCGPFTSVCFSVYQLCARRSTGVQNPSCPSHLRTLSFEIIKCGPRKPA